MQRAFDYGDKARGRVLLAGNATRADRDPRDVVNRMRQLQLVLSGYSIVLDLNFVSILYALKMPARGLPMPRIIYGTAW